MTFFLGMALNIKDAGADRLVRELRPRPAREGFDFARTDILAAHP